MSVIHNAHLLQGRLSKRQQLEKDIIKAHHDLMILECNDCIHTYPSQYYHDLSAARDRYHDLIGERNRGN